MKENIYLSNCWEALLVCLKQRLFDASCPFFVVQTVIVPNNCVKREIMLRLAQDLSVVAGIKLITLSQFLRGLEGKKIPNFMELSLLIQREFQKREEEEFNRYLINEKREVELAESLSTLFIHYGIYGKDAFVEWKDSAQKRLWNTLFSVKSPWSFPFEKLGGSHVKKMHPPLHVFGFSFLPKIYFDYFEERGSLFYCLSPCQYLWNDQEGLEHSLLGGLGKGGRALSRLLEGRSDTADYYVKMGNSYLHELQQDMLHLTEMRGEQDESVSLHAVSSRFQEVEVLFKHISSLLNTYSPKEIKVIAPKMELYLPFIQMFFQGTIPYAVFDYQEMNPFVLATIRLLSLWNERFEVSKVMQFLHLSYFREKHKISKEEIGLIESWVEEVKIGWGFDFANRQSYFEDPLLEKSDRGTWIGGLDHLLEELVTARSQRFSLSWEEGELLGKVASLLTELKEALAILIQGKKELTEWVKMTQSLVESFYVIPEEERVFFKELNALEIIDGAFGFESWMRVLSYLARRKETSQDHQLQVIYFGSFASIGAIPSKVTCLLGMEEGAYPVKEDNPSFTALTLPHALSKSDEQRAFFLEMLLGCRNSLWISYVSCDEKDGKKREPSPLVQQLKLQEIVHRDCQVPSVQLQKKGALLFQEGGSFCIGKRDVEVLIDVKSLTQLAKHPIQFYCNRKLQLYFEREEESDPEFTLSHLNRFLAKQSDKIDGRYLPQGAFTKLAEKRVIEEKEDVTGLLEAFNLSQSDLVSWNLKPGAHRFSLGEGRTAVIFGKLDNVTPLGLLSLASHKTADVAKVWPMYLLYLNLVKENKHLLCLKTGKRVPAPADPEQQLLQFLHYYELAQETPSPFMPDWVGSFKKGDVLDLNKALVTSFRSAFFPDPYLDWMKEREAIPSAELLMQQWGQLGRDLYAFI